MIYKGIAGVKTLMQTEQDNEIFQAIHAAFAELEYLRKFRNDLQEENTRLLLENRKLRNDIPAPNLETVAHAAALAGVKALPVDNGLALMFGGFTLQLYVNGLFKLWKTPAKT